MYIQKSIHAGVHLPIYVTRYAYIHLYLYIYHLFMSSCLRFVSTISTLFAPTHVYICTPTYVYISYTRRRICIGH